MKKTIASLCLAFFAAAVLSGCAFGNFGRADMTYSKMEVPKGLTGADKEEVLTHLGVPDSVTRDGSTEYWSYRNKCGYYMLLFGQTLEKDLVLNFKEGKVASSFLVDKGETTGLLSSQGSVTR